MQWCNCVSMDTGVGKACAQIIVVKGIVLRPSCSHTLILKILVNSIPFYFNNILKPPLEGRAHKLSKDMFQFIQGLPFSKGYFS